MNIFTFLATYLRARHDNDEGATAVEYSLLAALIAGVIVVAVTALGGRITTMFNNLVTAIS
ncbi:MULTISPECIES: Flp family type IVb pilin [Actinoplanes]|uniref:Flp family type IVb pilin n=1 Tax=Actinoplanes TaxID=1865 RepID=UPI0005F28EE1|nr:MULTISPECIES: Flp family type IVb pilin [Actinoplanes]GLY02630.1 hypothetical protein Acsp01_30090 [Actinoplanes sp. NBRC 101535]